VRLAARAQIKLLQRLRYLTPLASSLKVSARCCHLLIITVGIHRINSV
jgi:hypothetical protein